MVNTLNFTCTTDFSKEDWAEAFDIDGDILKGFVQSTYKFIMENRTDPLVTYGSLFEQISGLDNNTKNYLFFLGFVDLMATAMDAKKG